MAVSAPTVEVVLIFLGLVPGYVAYAVARTVGHVTVPLRRFEKTVWSLLGSGVSISVLYLGYAVSVRLARPEFVGWPGVTADVRTLAVAFPLLLVVAGGLGAAAGVVVRQRNIRKLSKDIPEPTWDYLMRKARNAGEPVEVRVTTETGREIHGYLGAIGTTNDMRDLLVLYPQTVTREDGRVTDRTDNGEFVYVHEDAVASVFFDTDLDLDLPDGE